ncbi:hypothetical protein PMIT1323_01207 [Prochlorococcus marinus str. MIT 1323]|nr:hypothetical protein PMIT1323_01207 [Prochlorococcus marinus str. MIT 1323]
MLAPVPFGEIRLTTQRGFMVEVLVLLTQFLEKLMCLGKLFTVGLRPKQLIMLILILRVRLELRLAFASVSK